MFSFAEVRKIIEATFEHDVGSILRRLAEMEAKHARKVHAARAIIRGETVKVDQHLFPHPGLAVLFLSACSMKPGEYPDMSTAPHEERKAYEELTNEVARLRLMRNKIIAALDQEWKARSIMQEKSDELKEGVPS